MSKKKASISEHSPLAGVDQLFKKTSEKGASNPAEAASSRPGRKPKERQLSPTTIRIFSDQLEWLDDLTYKAKKSGSASAVSNSSLVRALLDLCKEYNLNLKGIEEEEEIIERLKNTFELE